MEQDWTGSKLNHDLAETQSGELDRFRDSCVCIKRGGRQSDEVASRTRKDRSRSTNLIHLYHRRDMRVLIYGQLYLSTMRSFPSSAV